MKVLILQNELLHYRVPVFNQLHLTGGLELTVAHSGDPAPEDLILFNQVILKVKQTGPFVLHQGLYDFCCNYEVVITMFDMKWLTYMKLAFMKKRTFKLILWGIGVSTERGFDMDKRFDSIRFFIAKRADAMLFYSEQARKKYVDANFVESNLFVAPNSIESLNSQTTNTERDEFLFLGSLHERKKTIELIRAFQLGISRYNRPISLTIIGDGGQRKEIQELLTQEDLNHSVRLTGNLVDLNELKSYFNKAIACISPGQAGLSVLRSFSFGVPFICRKDAITGGERFDIKNNHNGMQYTGGAEELSDLLVKLVNDPNLARQWGSNALQYFKNNRDISHMVRGFVKVIYGVNE